MARAFIASVPLGIVVVAALVVPLLVIPGTFGFEGWPTSPPNAVTDRNVRPETIAPAPVTLAVQKRPRRTPAAHRTLTFASAHPAASKRLAAGLTHAVRAPQRRTATFAQPRRRHHGAPQPQPQRPAHHHTSPPPSAPATPAAPTPQPNIPAPAQPAPQQVATQPAPVARNDPPPEPPAPTPTVQVIPPSLQPDQGQDCNGNGNGDGNGDGQGRGEHHGNGLALGHLLGHGHEHGQGDD